MRVHLVYPHGPSIGCPDAIGRNVTDYLRKWGHEVRQYTYDDYRAIKPGDDDALIGHPHTNPFTIFRRSSRRAGWRRIVAMFPFAHGLTWQMAFEEGSAQRADHVLAITGRHWIRTAPESIFSHWVPKLEHLDLAIDRRDFPVIKSRWGEAQKRRFVYIGNTLPPKNPEYLSQIALAMPEVEFAWIGGGKRPGEVIAGVKTLGHQNFATPAGKETVGRYDFLLTVGRSDANPTTVLEAMAWGLIPVCTPQSGYEDYASIPNVPLDDVAGAVKVLRGLMEAPSTALDEMREANWRMLDEYFTWERFAGQVRNALEAKGRPVMGPKGLGRRLALAKASVQGWLSAQSPIRPRTLATHLYRSITGRSRSEGFGAP